MARSWPVERALPVAGHRRPPPDPPIRADQIRRTFRFLVAPHRARVRAGGDIAWGVSGVPVDTVPGFPDRLRENPPRQGFFEHPEYLAVVLAKIRNPFTPERKL